MRGKKGLVFHIAMVLVTLIVMTQVYLVIKEKRASVEQEVGEDQFIVYGTLQEIENKNQYLQYQAQDNFNKVILEQAKKGGKYYDYCGSTAGFTYWKKGDLDCFPEPMTDFRKFYNRYFYNPDFSDITLSIIDEGSYITVEGHSENMYKASINKNPVIEEIG